MCVGFHAVHSARRATLEQGCCKRHAYGTASWDLGGLQPSGQRPGRVQGLESSDQPGEGQVVPLRNQIPWFAVGLITAGALERQKLAEDVAEPGGAGSELLDPPREVGLRRPEV